MKKEEKMTEVSACLQEIIDPNFYNQLCVGGKNRFPGFMPDDTHAVEGIQNYIDAAFWCEVNPLQGLRKTCPNFEWEYHEFEEDEKIPYPYKKLLRLMRESDFFWPANVFTQNKWVTARLKNTSQRPAAICGCFDPEPFFPNSDGSSIWSDNKELEDFIEMSYARSLNFLGPMDKRGWEKRRPKKA